MCRTSMHLLIQFFYSQQVQLELTFTKLQNLQIKCGNLKRYEFRDRLFRCIGIYQGLDLS
jgi:hypothetical protein